jgi:hypothetical protein
VRTTLKHEEEAMKTEQTNTPVPQLRQRLVPDIKKHMDALDERCLRRGRALHGGRAYMTASAAMHIERFFVPGLAQV